MLGPSGLVCSVFSSQCVNTQDHDSLYGFKNCSSALGTIEETLDCSRDILSGTFSPSILLGPILCPLCGTLATEKDVCKGRLSRYKSRTFWTDICHGPRTRRGKFRDCDALIAMVQEHLRICRLLGTAHECMSGRRMKSNVWQSYVCG